MTSPAQRHFQRVSASLASASAGEGESLVGKRLRADACETRDRSPSTQRYQVDRTKDRSEARRAAARIRRIRCRRVEWRAGRTGRCFNDRDDLARRRGRLRRRARYRPLCDRAPDDTARSIRPARSSTAIAEEFAEASLSSFKKDANGERVSVAQLNEVATAHRIGTTCTTRCAPSCTRRSVTRCERDGDSPAALEHLRRALELDERAGVKQDIARIEKASNAAGTNAGRT